MDKAVKDIILSKILRSDYREVMNCILDGHTHEETAEIVGFCQRQVARIASNCWQEVCVLLAEDKLKSEVNANEN